MTRKVVQVAAAPMGTMGVVKVVALADDGTVWQSTLGGAQGGTPSWTMLAALPPRDDAAQLPDGVKPVTL